MRVNFQVFLVLIRRFFLHGSSCLKNDIRRFSVEKNQERRESQENVMCKPKQSNVSSIHHLQRRADSIWDSIFEFFNDGSNNRRPRKITSHDLKAAKSKVK